MNTTLPTECAPAERAAPAELQRQAGAVARGLGLDRVTGTVPVLLMILNAQRQIVYANPAVLKLLNLEDPQQICGTRPGEAFHCVRAAHAPGGCGTSIHCRTCGALQAIQSAQRGEGGQPRAQAGGVDHQARSRPVFGQRHDRGVWRCLLAGSVGMRVRDLSVTRSAGTP